MEKESKKTDNEKLMDKIFVKKDNIWNKFYKDRHQDIDSFSSDYKCFLNDSKTERLCINNILQILKKAGYKKFNRDIKQIKNYKIFRNKVIIAWKTGKKPGHCPSLF